MSDPHNTPELASGGGGAGDQYPHTVGESFGLFGLCFYLASPWFKRRPRAKLKDLYIPIYTSLAKVVSGAAVAHASLLMIPTPTLTAVISPILEIIMTFK
jgi:hypothetical protein